MFTMPNAMLLILVSSFVSLKDFKKKLTLCFEDLDEMRRCAFMGLVSIYLL